MVDRRAREITGHITIRFLQLTFLSLNGSCKTLLITGAAACSFLYLIAVVLAPIAQRSVV